MRKTRRMTKGGFRGGMPGRSINRSSRSNTSRTKPRGASRANTIARQRGGAVRRSAQTRSRRQMGGIAASRNRMKTRGARRFANGGITGRTGGYGGYNKSYRIGKAANHGYGGGALGYREGSYWESGRPWTLNNLTGNADKDSNYSHFTTPNPPGPGKGQIPPGAEAINRSALSINKYNPPGNQRWDKKRRGTLGAGT